MSIKVDSPFAGAVWKAHIVCLAGLFRTDFKQLFLQNPDREWKDSF